MPGTRSSARQAAKNPSSPSSSQSKASPAAGSKRKASGTAPAAKKGKKGNGKGQATIEASMPSNEANEESEDVEMKDAEEPKPTEASNGQSSEATATKQDNEAEEGNSTTEERKEDAPAEKPEPRTNGGAGDENKAEEKNGLESIMDNAAGKGEDRQITEEGTGSKVSQADNAVEDSSKREEATPSNILEKGIIYFFFRGRVGINEPSDVNDIARSYIVLRPIPHGAKLSEGPIGDTNNVRMLSLPKKVLPVSPKDRFMTFVERANASLEDVKQQLSSSDYSTKTVGVRHTPAATPIGEGVYAITKTGRETHLAYILTIPSELGEVQNGVGLRQRGSYLTSAKNPETAAPANASLPQGPEYPKE